MTATPFAAIYMWGVPLVMLVLLIALLLDGGEEMKLHDVGIPHIGITCLIVAVAWPLVVTALLLFVAFGIVIWLFDDD